MTWTSGPRPRRRSRHVGTTSRRTSPRRGHGRLAESEHGVSLLIRALAILGFGKVPVSILMTCLMVIFGSTGLIANGLFESVAPWSWAPVVYFWPSLALALLTSLTLTGTVARGLNRIMPTRETCGHRGEWSGRSAWPSTGSPTAAAAW